MLHVLPVSRGAGVSVGGRGGAAEPPVAAPLPPRLGNRPDLGAEGHAPRPAAGVLRQAPERAPDARGARPVPGVLRPREGAAAGPPPPPPGPAGPAAALPPPP